MRRIELLEVRLENFRSFRKPAVFELSPTSGFKFIGGRNEVQPRLGPNGVGKSSLWDALLFCLYNSSVKGTRASELVSWGGSGRAHVTTRWLIDGDQTTIERWSSPNLLCIDGLAVEEKNVELLLGLTKKRFLQAIVFGQGVPLFIDLSIPERAALLDETLDLGIWLRLSAAAKQEHAKADVEVRKAREVLARLNGRLESLNDSARLEQLSQSWESAQQNKIDRAIEQVEAFEQDLLELKEKKSSIAERILAIPVLDKSQKSIDALVRYKEELRQGYQALYSQTIVAHEKHKFFENNSSCPTCFQMITPVFRDKQKRELMAAVATLTREMQDNGAVGNKVDKELQSKRGEHDAAFRKLSFLQEQRASVEANLKNQEKFINAAIAQVEALANETNPYLEQLESLGEAKRVVQEELRAAQGVIRRLQGAMLQAEYWAEAFRKVRLFLIGRVLKQLEIETAGAAVALGLIGWTIKFSTEAETKSGGTKLGIFVEITSPDATASWEVWSGGEAQRIRLAVAIGLSNMIQRMAGISISFEVWDEPSAWLSQEGIEDLLSCLQHRAETTGKSLWLCDHRAIIYSGFDEIWQVTKTSTGSTIELISSSEG